MQLHQRHKLLIALFLCWVRLFSQTYPSVHYTIKNGLPSNAVYCIYKDSKGLIWIGTDAGLVRFNGYEFKVYNKKNGIAGNFIRDIKEDKSGNLWIACYGDGLTKYDGSQFVNYSTKNGLIHNEIRCLYFDRKGNLYIGTERGLSSWNGERFLNFNTKSFDTYNRFQVMQFWEENNQLFFLSRTHGYFRVKNDGTKLSCDSLGKNYSQTLFVRINNEKLYSFSTGIYLDKSPDQFPINLQKHQKISEDIIWDYEKIGNEYFLAANCVFCDGGGLLKYQHGKITNVSRQFNIDSKQIWNLLYDKEEEKLWVSSLDKGFYVLDLKLPITFNSLKDFTSIGETETRIVSTKKELILSANDKITSEDFIRFAKKSLNNYLIPNEHSKPLNNKIIEAFINRSFEIKNFQTRSSLIYVATNIGFFELSQTRKFISYCPLESNLFQIRVNDIILCIPNGRTIFLKKNQSKWEIISLKNQQNEPKEINNIIHAGDQTFLTSELYGLYAIDDEKLEAQHFRSNYLNGVKIKTICSDDNNLLYIGTNEHEILVFKILNGNLIYQTKMTNDSYVGEVLLSLKYANNTLFLLSNRGLNLIKVGKHIFINEEQGLDFSDLTTISLKKDFIYIGTSLGYYAINYPNYFKPIVEKPIVSLSKINSFNKTLTGFSDGVLHVKYNENNLDFVLSKVKIYNAKNVELSYSLNKKSWSKIYGNSINLKELASGDYQIFIRQKNYLTGNTIIYPLVKISVAAPFWKTFWFMALVILLFISLVYLFYRLNINRIKRREQQKAVLIKRIAETKLEALQSQMNPHFIFNALTSIQSYVLKSDIDSSLHYMDQFSKLTRQTLEFSSKPQITLLEELEYLSRFISLEKMRFGDQVDVQIDAGELDTPKIFIPPLLIQPIVENAFEHGFTDRNKKYNLVIDFQVEKSHLHIMISDDGEGLSETPFKSDSKAIKIIRERLSLIDSNLSDFFSISRENNLTIVRFMLPLVTK